MTCIAGLEHGGKVYIGGDSAGVSGWSLRVRADEKVFVNGPFVMGFTTSFRMGQLLRYSLVVSTQAAHVDDQTFMHTEFIDAVRNCLRVGGYAEVSNGREAGGSFLVGYRGSLYFVGDDFQIGRVSGGFDAVGCGAELAIGAMAAASIRNPTARVTQALKIAEDYSAGVRGPFVVLSG